MNNQDSTIRAAGSWLVAASLLLAVVFVLHGPLAPDLDAQMDIVAASARRWTIIHWIAAVALSMFAVAGLIMLTGSTRLTQTPWTVSAWAVVTIGALWTATTAVAEATVITDAATGGNRDAFHTWWAFAEGRAAGFTAVALAFALVAGTESRRTSPIVPAWASTVGAVAGVASFTGWLFGMWIGMRWGNLLWVVSSLLMSLWTLWFGISLTRSAGVARETVVSDRSLQSAG